LDALRADAIRASFAASCSGTSGACARRPFHHDPRRENRDL